MPKGLSLSSSGLKCVSRPLRAESSEKNQNYFHNATMSTWQLSQIQVLNPKELREKTLI